MTFCWNFSSALYTCADSLKDPLYCTCGCPETCPHATRSEGLHPDNPMAIRYAGYIDPHTPVNKEAHMTFLFDCTLGSREFRDLQSLRSLQPVFCHHLPLSTQILRERERDRQRGTLSVRQRGMRLSFLGFCWTVDKSYEGHHVGVALKD